MTETTAPRVEATADEVERVAEAILRAQLDWEWRPQAPFRRADNLHRDYAIYLARAAIAALRPAPEQWTCFHCGETFTSRREAESHFGPTEDSIPACKIKGGAEGSMLRALRRAEQDAAEAWFAIHHETTDAARAYHAQASRHQEQLRLAEELGYERGLDDGRAPRPTPALVKEAPGHTDLMISPGAIDQALERDPPAPMQDVQIKYMVSRFLNWRLPETFNPDGGVSFQPTYDEGTPYVGKNEPTGTNLFDAEQAEAMVRYMLDGLPIEDPTPTPVPQIILEAAEERAKYLTLLDLPHLTDRAAAIRAAIAEVREQKSDPPAPVDVEEIGQTVLYLRSAAQAASTAQRLLAEAKSARNGAPGDAYAWSAPENTREWKAADIIESLLSRLENQSSGQRPRWRHKKRGSEYEEIGCGKYQQATAEPPEDGDLVVVYRDSDGNLYCRQAWEFDDGRFERVPRAANSQPIESDGWRDMESAPKDGTWVLLRYAGEPTPVAAKWVTWTGSDRKPRGEWTENFIRSSGEPVAWFPLPPIEGTLVQRSE